MKRPRSDALPENRDYRDTGCEESPTCLRCPLPQCRYDVYGGSAVFRRRERDEAIVAAHAKGHRLEDIAGNHGVHPRSIYRILAESRRMRSER